MGLFDMKPKEKRGSERESFDSIAEAFVTAQTKLSNLIEEKDGHVARLDREMNTLELQKAAAQHEQDKAKKMHAKISEWVG